MTTVGVVSGKGGTGKTVVTAALADCIPGAKVFADCDVDAANLSLILGPDHTESRPYSGLPCAVIDPARCTSCGICREHCRFDAIREAGTGMQVDPLRCEGCGVCERVCPEGAVTLEPRQAGEVHRSTTAAGPLAHADLFPGSGTSGLLVHEVKRDAVAMRSGEAIILCDGPPGIGCPAMATLSGLDAAVIVTEPSVSALHDLTRLVRVCRGFSARLFVVINRSDLDPACAAAIKTYCAVEGLFLLGTIPFDPAVIAAVRKGVPVTRTPSPAASAMRVISRRLREALGDANE
ncbi:MAG: (4Fe-4S)-binding protein [Methanomicrobiales archaeon]|nr:(4Fe-4S)-binding protein [Methanomicrobiales archaeon]